MRSPKAARIASIAAPPGAVSRCAITSVSTMSMPKAAKRSVTALLPLPIPPVRPTM